MSCFISNFPITGLLLLEMFVVVVVSYNNNTKLKVYKYIKTMKKNIHIKIKILS